MEGFIVTGTSRGLGEAIARRLIEQNAALFCVSRSENGKLSELARKSGSALEFFPFDLSQTVGIPALMEGIFGRISGQAYSSLTLINNAAVLEPVMPAGKAAAADIIRHYEVNLIAPVLLTSLFIQHARSMRIDKTVVQISSGAARKPYSGWSCYCGAKAGLEMASQCIALEQGGGEYPVKVISFVPGVVDTAMQERIRKSVKEDFPDIGRFIALKEEGKLASPAEVASKLVDVLKRNNFLNGETVYYRDL